MEYATLALGLALPWALGIAALSAMGWPAEGMADASTHQVGAGGHGALRAGFGYFLGSMLLTFWMRTLSAVGVPFGWLSIGGPLAATCIALGIFASRRHRLTGAAFLGDVKAFVSPDLPRWQRVLWQTLIAWLAIRFMLLAGSVAWQPLYPWDAWVQWATKARVWYELRHMAPFVFADAWFQAPSGAYFDAAPGYPATVPLLQVWSCIALGRWDDAAMNWPWWLMLIALSLAVYGTLRDEGLAPLLALVGAYLVASLPLADVHVALAGYADLPMACIFTMAALSMYRWARHRRRGDAALALFFAVCCPLIKIPGWIWAATLVPGVIMARFPRHGLRIVGTGFFLAALGLVAVAKSAPVILGYRLHLDFEPGWRSLGESFFLFGNWHLLWYGVVALAVLAWRRLLDPVLAPLLVVVVSGLGFLFVVFAFTNATAFVADFTTVNRATLHLSPLIVVFCALLWNELTSAPATAVACSSTLAADGGAAND